MSGPDTARRLLRALNELDDWSTTNAIGQHPKLSAEQVDLALHALMIDGVITSTTNEHGNPLYQLTPIGREALDQMCVASLPTSARRCRNRSRPNRTTQ